MKTSQSFKKLCAILLFAFLTLNLYAQQKTYFCEVKGIEKDFKSGLKIIFDFGDSKSYKPSGLSSKLKIVDEEGNEITFYSMVAVTNFMVEHGWEFKQAFSSAYGGSPILHYIFCKQANSMEEAKAGIVTKSEYKDNQ